MSDSYAIGVGDGILEIEEAKGTSYTERNIL